MSMKNMKQHLRVLNMLKKGPGHRGTATTFFEAENPKVTIDQTEVDKLSKLSPKWWNVNGEMRALHSMNKLRIQLVRDCLIYATNGSFEQLNKAEPLKGFKIMDVGCGGGILSEPLARIGADVTGLDASNELIDVAKDHASKDSSVAHKIQYVCGTVEDHAKENVERYDAVVASEVLEHVVEKDLFLESCVKSLKPGGSLFITTLNKTMVAWVAGVMTAEYVLHLVPQETHDWEKFITPHQVQYTLEKHGCYTRLVHGMFYNFILNEWFWNPNTAINYALHAVKKK